MAVWVALVDHMVPLRLNLYCSRPCSIPTRGPLFHVIYSLSFSAAVYPIMVKMPEKTTTKKKKLQHVSGSSPNISHIATFSLNICLNMKTLWHTSFSEPGSHAGHKHHFHQCLPDIDFWLRRQLYSWMFLQSWIKPTVQHFKMPRMLEGQWKLNHFFKNILSVTFLQDMMNILCPAHCWTHFSYSSVKKFSTSQLLPYWSTDIFALRQNDPLA